MFESIDQQDYEILIRKRGDGDYASYCPQLAHMIKGSEHVEVEDAMKAFVLDHIAKIKERSAQNQN
ncbi:MAG: hypothetical protein JSS89_02170 [Bacteroidetes bacterium]|nr:hypothetical protein [Bacteroidota bacterium]